MTDWEIVEVEFDNGENVTIRQAWVGCEPPGPIGSGIEYLNTRFEWNLADDGVWERTVYSWKLVNEDESD